MSISTDVRWAVRQRAHFACEFCGVTETDTGGELTIDHFQPHTKGGTDAPENLLYCCHRCNQYKADYWPIQVGAAAPLCGTAGARHRSATPSRWAWEARVVPLAERWDGRWGGGRGASRAAR